MSLIETGARTVARDVEGINKVIVKAVRRIVNGVTVGVGEAQRQIAHSTPRRKLKCMVYGVRGVLKPKDIAETLERGALGIGVTSAGYAEIYQCLTSDGHTAWSRQSSAVVVAVSADSLTWLVRIRRGRYTEELIEVVEHGQMRALAAHVRNGGHDVRGEFPLDIQMPLLDIGPNRFVWDGVDCQREKQSSADVAVAADIKLLSSQYEWR